MKSCSSANSTISSKRFCDLALGQAEHDAVDEDVLAAGNLGMEAGAELDERGDRPLHRHRAGRRLRDAGHQLERRALARPVSADDAEGAARGTMNDTSCQGRKRLVGLQVANDAALQEGALQRRELPRRCNGGRSSMTSKARSPASHGLRERVAQPIEQPVAGQERTPTDVTPSASSHLQWPNGPGRTESPGRRSPDA